MGDLAKSDEDVLSFAMFPEIGKLFLEERKNNTLVPEPLINEANSSQNTALSTEFDIDLHGESYHIRVAGYGAREQEKQACFLWVDGVPEEVIIHFDEEEDAPQLSPNKRPSSPGDITVAMPGTLVSVNVGVGDKVTMGQTLLVLEAMKMETEIQAPFNGNVVDVFCHKGDKVTPAQVLMYVMKDET